MNRGTIIEWINLIEKADTDKCEGFFPHKVCALLFVVDNLIFSEIDKSPAEIEVAFGVDWNYAKDFFQKTDTELESFVENEYTSSDAEKLFWKAESEHKLVFAKRY